jgi:hypothetical protein
MFSRPKKRNAETKSTQINVTCVGKSNSLAESSLFPRSVCACFFGGAILSVAFLAMECFEVVVFAEG